MRRADRLFQIVQFLRSRRVTTARWFSEVLEISERTVYRDIQDLMASGVPIEGEAGVGYVIRRGYDLPPLMFTRDEITALTLGARIVNSWADPGLAKAAQSVLSKVETVLPDPLKGALDQTRLFSPLVQISAQVAAFMGELRRAVDCSNKVVISYKRADGADSRRTIWPLGLFFWGTVWTLGAWCELRQAFRNFRLDRINTLQVCNELYPNESGRTLEAMIAYEENRMNDDQTM
ncbi:Transcriptional regulator, DeoR family [hydrothermal vent metagenome]|uniref:Transcriptional regulator, DeoR family n=1 Tax=hydrothermal vent metagenome TaxID=652676 RepID=A0A3B0ZDI2_9ZZZZ